MRFFLLPVRLVLPRLFLFLLLLAGPGRGWAQAPSFTQAVSFNPSGNNDTSQGRAVATDAAGNQYVTGYFTGTITLGSITLISAGLGDIFVAKRSVTGTWLWAIRAGGNGQDSGFGVAVDAAGNVLVTGFFDGTASFATSPAPTNLVSVGLGITDVFVAKFGASTGACVWAVKAGGSDNDYTYGVAVDAGGNALVTGYFANTASFATSSVPITLVSTGGYNIFVAKFGASTGACVWAVQAGGSGDDSGYGVAVDAGGNALVTGHFFGTASFATSPAPTSLVSAGGSQDVFVAKFGASTGTCAWAVRAGGTDIDYGLAVAVDAGGNALLTGSFSGTASFATNPTPTTLLSAGRADVFVAKFGASTGACTWAVRAGGSDTDFGLALAVDRGGNVLVTGEFATTANFATNLAPTVLTSAGSQDVFVAKFGASTGTCVWAVRAGGSGEDVGEGVGIDADGNALLTGYFTTRASFGNQTLVGGSGIYVFTGYVVVLPGAGTLTTTTAAALPAFTLFPNPARSTCQVQGTAAGAAVTLLDALGRPLARALADASGTTRLALPVGLAPGLYLVRSGGQLRRLAVE